MVKFRLVVDFRHRLPSVAGEVSVQSLLVLGRLVVEVGLGAAKLVFAWI